MGDIEVPLWLKSLPLAPVYRPTETEFADPIAFISKIEKEASAFGICKVIPPFPKPSKRFVFSKINGSLSKSPELGPDPNSGSLALENGVFTTRHQELGSRRTKLAVHKQVWQSGEVYTLEQFEAKSKAFARTQLGHIKEVTPLIVEALFWKAMGEKPIYIEYANDVPGSGFGVPAEPFRYYSHRRRRKRKFDHGVENTIHGSVAKSNNDVCGVSDRQQKSSGSGSDREGTAGWKLSNSPWNLQVIARSPGSLTRFMPDEVPGVTSPMVYIGMLFSWFAWHVEDHELHSLNFLHTGSSKTWYAVPGSYASSMEDVVRVQGFGGNIDRLAAFTMLGEKTTLLSPEIVVASGIPCCRLVQNPGEFVVTFPRAYHIGFSHGFNCGEAANFATPEWLKVAKEAAVRRAAMNYLPMLSHQQLLYMLTMSFVSRVPRSFLPGVRSSRMRDRKKEEREILVRKAFLGDMMSEHHILKTLLGKESTLCAVLWHPDLLPSPNHGSQTNPLSVECKKETVQCNVGPNELFDCKDDCLAEDEVPGNVTEVVVNTISPVEIQRDEYCKGNSVDYDSDLDSDFPCILDIDSGMLACVACGVLGYPFMSIVQPSDKACKELLPTNCVITNEGIGNSRSLKPSVSSCVNDAFKESDSDNVKEDGVKLAVQEEQFKSKLDAMTGRQLENTNVYQETGATSSFNQVITRTPEDFCLISTDDTVRNCDMPPVGSASSSFSSVVMNTEFACEKVRNVAKSYQIQPSGGSKPFEATEKSSESSALIEGFELCHETGASFEKSAAEEGGEDLIRMWNTTSEFLRPRIFCLQHALEIEKLLEQKGGANVLIICHSDYLKIRGQAVSVAEEIGTHFKCMDVPMKNASQADLELINKSIDDDEHKECGEDWTSKLGVNLRYCVKLRKQTSIKPEQLTLSLGGIFSDPVVLSVGSSLKWHCRKSRTHQKTIPQSQSDLNDAADVNKDELVVGKLLLSAEFQVRKTSEGEPSSMSRAMKRRGQLRRKSPEALDNGLDAAIADEEPHTGDNSSSCGCMNEELEMNYTKLAKLPHVSILAPENSQTHSVSLATQEIISTSEVCATAKPNEFILPAPSSIEKPKQVEFEAAGVTNAVDAHCSFGFNDSVMHQNIDSVDEPKMRSGIGGVEFVQPYTGLPLPGSYVPHTKIRTPIKTYYKRKIRKSIKPGFDPNTSKVAWSDPVTSNVDQSDKSENQPTLSISGIDSPAETIATGGSILQSEDLTASGILLVDATEMQQEIQTPVETGPKTELEAISSIPCSSGACSKLQDVRMTDKVSNMNVTLSNSSAPTGITTPEGSDINQMIITADEGNATCACGGPLKGAAERDHGHPSIDDSKPREKQRKKRKREADRIRSCQFGGSGFIRSPCEGLRPRSRCTASYGRIHRKAHNVHVHRKNEVSEVRSEGPIHRWDKEKGLYSCDFAGCHMRFNLQGELKTHKRNRCTYEGCGKRFRAHEYVVRHQRVHTDERPLKCPWEGCNMSFKWAWARTEHIRVHTGERPYKCKVSGCGLTFRFVSDFSRHRRKTGHYVN